MYIYIYIVYIYLLFEIHIANHSFPRLLYRYFQILSAMLTQ